MATNIDDLIIENSLSATTLTATTLFLGTTSISSSNSSFSSLSATTLSGRTIYSGSTDLSLLIRGTSGNLWSGSTGSNSIIANNNTQNLASGSFSFVAGSTNVASGNYSFVSGGRYNTASTVYSSIGGGKGNTASGVYATVFGGQSNSASSNRSSVLGGRSNVASSLYSSVGGGSGNTASGRFTHIGGGLANVATSFYSSIPGGKSNSASGRFAIVAGNTNTTSALQSAILNGSGNTLNSSAFNSVILGQSDFTGNEPNTLYAMNVTGFTMSATTLYSGSTNIGSLFAPIGLQLTSGVTRVQPGTNTYTGGTANLPTVNVSALTINTLDASGTSRFTTLSATTFSGATIFSGSTNISSLFTFTKLDFQSISTANTVTATSTLVDIGSMILTARTLGSSNTTYQIYFNANFSNNTSGSLSAFRILNNSTEIANSFRQMHAGGAQFANTRRVVDSMCFITGVTSGDVIKVQMSASTGTVSVSGRTLSIIGVLNSNIV